MSDLTDEERKRLRGAIGNVLSVASNFPDAVQIRLLGQDMGPLIDKVTDAVAVLYPVIAHKVAEEIAASVDSSGHDWSAMPALALFQEARRIRDSYPAPTSPEGQNNG